MNLISIPVPVSEVLDRISILKIKLKKIKTPVKVKNIQKELGLLQKIKNEHVPNSKKINALYKRLEDVNLLMWEQLDEWFEYRKNEKIDINLAKLLNSVQIENNEIRFPIKREIDKLLQSTILEEKSYLPDESS